MSRTRIKMCGICRPEDAIAAARAGADAVGMILHAPGRRRVIEGEHAKAVAAAVPPMVARAGVFVDARPSFVALAARALNLDFVQLHGSESVDFVRALPTLAVVKAVRPDEYAAWATLDLPNLVALLIESGKGGTGESTDWDAVADALARTPPRVPIFLAGGLGADRVGAVVTRFSPWCVDVSSGIESEPAVKSPEKMNAFARAVRDADIGG